eukprot:3575418-Pleurochrysis_carterae.AAC.3
MQAAEQKRLLGDPYGHALEQEATVHYLIVASERAELCARDTDGRYAQYSVSTAAPHASAEMTLSHASSSIGSSTNNIRFEKHTLSLCCAAGLRGVRDLMTLHSEPVLSSKTRKVC